MGYQLDPEEQQNRGLIEIDVLEPEMVKKEKRQKRKAKQNNKFLVRHFGSPV
jgi:hypothetical protein